MSGSYADSYSPSPMRLNSPVLLSAHITRQHEIHQCHGGPEDRLLDTVRGLHEYSVLSDEEPHL